MWTRSQREALQVLADVYVQQGFPEHAILVLEALHENDPEARDVLAALAYAYLRAGRYDDALAATDAYLASGPPDGQEAPILLIRSRATWGMGSSDEALDYFQRYLALETHP